MQKIALLAIALFYCGVLFAEDVNIWEDTARHKKVKMTAYLSEGEKNKAIIVCPGGSYFWHAAAGEGHEVAKWLQGQGISAFVLHYRTAGFMAFFTHYRYLFRGVRYPDAGEDLRQALRYIKAHAAEYRVDTEDIGVMGFSAGGHLALSGGVLFKAEDKPAFIALIYPVVTMLEPYVHKRSRRALLGDGRRHNRQLCDSLSLEKHISATCPPVFLVNCKDDPKVDYHNSTLLDSALTAAQVSHYYVQYATGGHGFGISEKKASAESLRWKQEFLKWIK